MESKAKIIGRAVLDEAKLLISQFRALCIVGPRQSGKTTLSKLLFPSKPYLSFENPAIQAEAAADPAGFLTQFSDGAILDEVQRVPDIFRCLQGVLDKSNARGQYILTGSNNFLLQEQISQSLAGRVGYLQLLPLSLSELQDAGLAEELDQHILKGGYPEIWNQKLIAPKWMSAYVQTYVQRDVRLLRNITNLADFNRFLFLCADRAGQLVNREDMARSIGVDTKTIQAWFSVLESSYVVQLLQPWFNNLNKRIIKSPKLYFYDTGLLCFLLGLQNKDSLRSHPRYGSIFENWVISEITKNRLNQGVSGGLYFFRDSAGNEVDLLLEKNGKTIPVEIKSARRFDSGMLSGIRYWKKLTRDDEGLLIYEGTGRDIPESGVELLGWHDVSGVL